MLRFTRLALVTCAAFLATAGCSTSEGRPDSELKGLVDTPASERAPIDVERAADKADELLRAAKTPHRDVTTALGPHQFKGSSNVEVHSGGVLVDSISDTTSIDVDDAGNYRAVLENSHDYGREIIYLGGELYLRQRYNKFHRRPPADKDEPLRLRDEIFATLGDYLEILVYGAELSKRGRAEVAGRSGIAIELKTAPKPSSRPREKLAHRKWRETISVKDVKGEIVLDEDTGAPLRAKVEGTATYTRDGQTFEMVVAIEHEITAVGSSPAITAPPDDKTVVTSEHYRELEERETLLKGIAPPARKAPIPSDHAGTRTEP